ncbi:isocitrate/isopropylmalate dehydrogenase family protein [Halococcus salifodinae]|uniref:3-isopropylmalate dehydrogenase n=1 Tax=Halococcus salifodinae DSM 8989 TaxID=1227456 RepID=M0N8H5_9EURY|nr:isocitrate/isopropylmalate family dehydrogenase [Halococcus salifodinae]EMA54262.1 3-isopropylmalate dehydrogenase [Halococcus salifodinae DSM 8989]
MAYDIALIPGDGIGQEVVAAARPVLDAAAADAGFSLDYERFDWGSERYLDEGSMMPDDGIDRLRGRDAILLGAVGHPDIPDHVTLRGLMLPIRKRFNQQVCERPAVLYDGVESPLRGYGGGDIDLVVFRENTEGEYADVGGREHRGFDHEVAIQSAVFTRQGTEDVVRAAFEAATERGGKLTNVTKSNAQAYGMVLWDDVVAEVGEEYPDVEVERLLVDAASMDFVRRPDEFDVVVASNLFGDILTDLGAIVTGSMGLAPSANVNVEGDYPSMFEPVHGSAPDIVGQGVANPLATVLSGAMLFDHLGEGVAGERLESAVADQLADADAPRTPDLGVDAGTEAVVDDLRGRL